MAKKSPVTPAVRFLREQRVEFTEHPYAYEERGGTKVSSRELGFPEHQVIKTLVFEDEEKRPYLVLMHGDKEVSAKELARILNVKSCRPCDPKTAHRLTGYQVGGISPFGTRRPISVLVEESILELNRILINGGKRGFLVGLAPSELKRVMDIRAVKVGR